MNDDSHTRTPPILGLAVALVVVVGIGVLVVAASHARTVRHSATAALTAAAASVPDTLDTRAILDGTETCIYQNVRPGVGDLDPTIVARKCLATTAAQDPALRDAAKPIYAALSKAGAKAEAAESGRR